MEIYVYGTGCGAGELTRETLEPTRIAAFVESQPTLETFLGRPVISISMLAERTVDLLIVTAKDAPAFPFSPEKVLYLKNHLALIDRNRSYDAGSLGRCLCRTAAAAGDTGARAALGRWLPCRTG